MRRINKFKKGAASFYIVAISTLILVIIAASFAAVIISEITRTSNDDLAQSAYDSAMAGVEDAKLAYYNYQNCKAGAKYDSNSGIDCETITRWVEDDSEGDCDMVANILGRAPDENGVLVQEGTTNNNMQQYYTCVKIKNKTKDILGIVSESNPEYIVRAKFDGIDVSKIKKVKVQWHADSDGESKEFKYEKLTGDGDGIFGVDMVMPAVISVGMIQTSQSFNLSDFDVTVGEQTDRGTVYLVPTDDDNVEAIEDKFDVAENGYIDKNGFLKSNNKVAKNLPYVVKCEGTNDYACSVDIEIPDPVGGSRSAETFIFKVSLPYGGPSTKFSLEFYCDNDEVCSEATIDGEKKESSQAILDGVQVSIDSTGKANDLYRRVEVRLEPEMSSYPYPFYAMQVLGNNSNDSVILKDLYPTSEYNF